MKDPQTGDTNYPFLVSKINIFGGGSRQGFEFYYDTQFGTGLTFKTWTGGTDIGPGANAGAAAGTDGEWHHVVGIRQGTTLDLYVDGVLAGSKSHASIGNVDNTHALTFGQDGAGGERSNASLDEVRLYNRALTATEIATLSNQREIVVDTTSDNNDAAIVDGNSAHTISYLYNNKGADGFISLREAIIAANNTANFDSLTPDRIHFAISTSDGGYVDPTPGLPLSGDEYWTIAIGSALADITDALVIDGTTQVGFGGSPVIELDGSSAGGGADGFRLIAGSSGSTIQGFAINRFVGDGINVAAGSDGNTIVGNYLGTDVTGLIDLGNGDNGIELFSANNTVGGTTATLRNVIAGNTGTGIYLGGAGATGNTFLGNYVGVDATGATALANNVGLFLNIGANGNTIGGLVAGSGNVFSGNAYTGILIGGSGTDANIFYGNRIGTNAAGDAAVANGNAGIRIENSASNNVIGSNTPSHRNLISGNAGNGIAITSSASGNVVQGNFIGTNLAGTASVANGFSGVAISAGPSNQIGGAGAGEGNLIAYNSAGVEVTSGTGNAILGNQLHSNAGLGIDLGTGGVTNNDSDDGDSGANNLLNFPVLTNVVQNGANLDINFDVDLAAGNYRIEFFDNPGGLDNSGFGEGQTFIGFVDIAVTGAAGYESFSTSLASVTASNILNITTTATENLGGGNYGSTSEFGPQFQGAGVITVTTTSDTSDGDTSSIAALLGNKGADGLISLREAIIATNNTANIGGSPDRIHFNISLGDGGFVGTNGVDGRWVINVASALPQITDAVILDATSQTTNVGNSNPGLLGTGGTVGVEGLTLDQVERPEIEIVGTTAVATGFNIAASDVTVRGFSMRGFGNSTTTGAIILQAGFANALIEGNVFGSGSAALVDPGSGNRMSTGIVALGADNGIARNNIVAFARYRGIMVHNASDGWLIENNEVFDIGLDGLADGITIADNTTAATVRGNLVYGVSTQGIAVAPNANWSTIVNNTVTGNGVGELSAAPVQSDGIGVRSGASNISIDRNIVSGNYGAGVQVNNGATNISIRQNSIFNNGTILSRNGSAATGQIGIDLHSASDNVDLGTSPYVTANDVGDGDTGGNGLQNFPVLTSATTSGGNTTITGTFNSNASTTYRIEFFSSTTGDGSGHGEGEVYLGFAAVTTDGSGNATINETLVGVSVTPGHVVSATATVDLGGGNFGSTSEFAQNVTAALGTSVIVVDTTSDTADGDTSSIAALLSNKGADGFISLREAIVAANNTANGGTPDEIRFSIAGAGPHTINVLSALPDITDALVIDGTSEPDFAGTPIIELNGASAGATADGLTLASGSSGSTIRGLVINRFAFNGIEVGLSDNHVIVGNFIGTDVTGLLDLGNGDRGIKFDFSDGNTIGGTTAADRNVIAGNTNAGIHFGNGSVNNTIIGNYIGVGADGTTALGNSAAGVTIGLSATGVRVGGATASEGNIIANNAGDGVYLFATASADNPILGNSIYANGGLAIAIGSDGVTYNDGDDVDTGANDLLNFPILTNVVQNGSNLDIDFDVDLPAGNYRIEFFDNPGGLDASGFGEGQSFIGFVDIAVTGAAGYESFSTTLSSVTASNILNITTTATENLGGGNYGSTSEFGPQFAGVGVIIVDTTSDTSDGDTSSIAALLGNRGADGFISLREAILATNNTANGASADQIHFNIAGAGVHVIAPTTVLPSISDALVIDGLTQSGASAGVLVTGTQHTLLIQLDGSSAGNVAAGLVVDADDVTIRGLIIGNWTGASNDGIEVTNANNVTISENYIGTDAAGMAAAANSQSGIVIEDSANFVVRNNLISGNASLGINIQSSLSSGGLVAGNLVGTNATGTGALANGSNGIYFNNAASGNTIGGTTAVDRNVISGNADSGIFFSSFGGGSTNTIVGNYIGLNRTGDARLANNGFGIDLFGSNSSTIGGTAAGAGNVISGNALSGVRITNGRSGNQILGNLIGTDAGGIVDLGNLQSGVVIDGAATNNTVGGTTAAARNIISGNDQYGVLISGAGTNSNVVLGNYIGTDASGSLRLGNGSDGVVVAGGAANNTIGGTAVGQANIIAFNSAAGVQLADSGSTGNRIVGNSIFANAELGIDVVGGSEDGYGVTANDPGDGDTGANNLQNFPVLTSSITSGGNTIIEGTLNAASSATYDIHYYASPVGDDSGHGEGKLYLGSDTVATDGGGNAAINTVFSGLSIASGYIVTATATSTSGSTSEFSAGVVARAPKIIVSPVEPTAVGAEIVVNSITAGNQYVYGYNPNSLAVLDDGRFIVAFDSFGNHDGDGGGVYVRIFNADGTPAGGDILVNDVTAGDQSGATIAADGNGNFVVTWNDLNGRDGDQSGVFARRFDSAGNALGASFQVNTTTSSAQEGTSVAMDASGNFVIAWTDYSGLDGDSGQGGVFFRRFAADGTPITGEVQATITTAGAQFASSLDMNDAGQLVITWTSNDGSSNGVFARVYDAAGAALTGEVAVNSTTSGNQTAPDVEIAANGNFVVSWMSNGQDGSKYGTYVRLFNVSGAALTGEIQVNELTAEDQRYANVAADSAGNFVAVFDDRNGADGNGAGAFGQRFDSFGNKVGGNFVLNSATQGQQFWPVVDLNDRGDLVAAWNHQPTAGGDIDVRAQRFQLGAVTSEDGTSVIGSVVLDTQPTDDVTINVTVDDLSEGTTVTTSLTFTTGNWNVAQYITITGVDDALFDGDVQYSIILAPATRTDSDYNGLDPDDIVVTNLDNEGNRIVVDTTSDVMDGNTSSIAALLANKGADGFISLREAIIAANNTVNVGGPDEIHFSISTSDAGYVDPTPGSPGSGDEYWTIAVASALPDITDAVVLDASSQPGFTSTPVIELDGSTAGAGADGFTLTSGSDGSTIRGFAINQFANHGIEINNSSTNTIAANFIGTDITGQLDRGNGMVGVWLQNGAANNLIGGSTAMDRNVISGNGQQGVAVVHATSTGNLIRGNYIGLSADGSAAIGNGASGVELAVGATGNTVGGTTAGERNVISGNGVAGVALSTAATTGNWIQGNWIGLNANGDAAIGNLGSGVYGAAAGANTIGGAAPGAGNVISGNGVWGVFLISSNGLTIHGNTIGLDPTRTSTIGNVGDGIQIDNGSNHVIGGVNPGEANVISGNGDDGVVVNGATGVTIRGNSISGNSGDGIDLGSNGVSVNDPGDADSGANNLQNFPVITSATVASGSMNIAGSLNSLASGSYTIDFYSSSLADASGYGEGEVYLGSTTVITNGSGDVDFSTSLARSVTAGHIITATATDASGNTSEFSAGATSVAGAAILVVDTTSETSDGDTSNIAALLANKGADGFISLREAILATNNTVNGASPDQIHFNISALDAGYIDPDATPGNGDEFWSIAVASALPGLTDAVVIDGLTQTGATAGDLDEGVPHDLVIELNGSGAGGPNIPGLAIGGTGAMVRGLVINRFSGPGVTISGDNVLLQTNYIGTDTTGSAASANAHGVYILSADGSVLGGSLAGQGNVIAGNASINVFGLLSNGAVVEGNFIGTNAAGTAFIGGNGLVMGSSNNWSVGGATHTIGAVDGQANLIAGSSAININGASSGHVIQWNFLNTNLAGSAALPGTINGVLISGTSAIDNILIGGNAAGAGNLITSGNASGYGLSITESGAAMFSNISVQGNIIGANITGQSDIMSGARGILMTVTGAGNVIGGTSQFNFASGGAGNLIAGASVYGVGIGAGGRGTISGNLIGTNMDGSAAIGNAVGISSSGNGVTIGGTTTGQRNVISGNTSYGIQILAAGSNHSVIGNYVGTDASGALDLGNALSGLYVQGSNNTIGGSTASERNVISGNNQWGVAIAGASASGNVVSGNFIGTNAAGTGDLGNTFSGVQISGGASGNRIGGVVVGERNVVSGNDQQGIVITGSGTNNNVIQGNYVGLNATGSAALGNSNAGVDISVSAANNVVGGTTAAERNIISGNSGAGVGLSGNAVNNTISGNWIGLNADGNAALGNAGGGVVTVTAGANTIGGTTAGAGNVISGNGGGWGILVTASSNGIEILGNVIGLAPSLASVIANAGAGVRVDSSSNINIGGVLAGQANIIRGNTGDGVAVNGGSGVRIRGNSISGNGEIGIDLDGGNVTANDSGDGDSGGNNLQNFPVISTATVAPSSIHIAGSLNSLASGTYTIDFYSSPLADASGYGEGEVYLGSTTVITNGSGDVNFSASLAQSVTAGHVITATATDASGNTSEFSAAATSVAGAAILVVDTTSDTSDGDTSNIAALLANKGADGFISLREAIIAANNTINVGAADEIWFNISTSDAGYIDPTPGSPGSGDEYWSIAPSSTFATITDAVVIDGGTQLGSDLTWATRRLTIQIDGAGVASGNLFAFDAADSTIRGFAIGNTPGAAIQGTENADNLVIESNYLGFGVDGLTAMTISPNAIRTTGTDNFRIGGTSVDSRNLIGNTSGTAVFIDDNTTGGVIANNWIGVDRTGLAAGGVTNAGIRIDTSSGILVGGAGQGNLIAGTATGIAILQNASNIDILGNTVGFGSDGTTAIAQSSHGISVQTGSSDVRIGDGTVAGRNVVGNATTGIRISTTGGNTSVQGNYVGVAVDGTTAAGNSKGITVDDASNVTIGGANAGEGNIIANSAIVGVALIDEASDGFTNGLSILGNQIHSNGGLGIDLTAAAGDANGDGVTANDLGDADTGANNLQNYPVLQYANSDGIGTINIVGSLNSNASTTYRIEFFASNSADGSGHGEAERYLGFTTVTTDGSGNANFNVNLSAVVADGEFIAGTTTVDLGGGNYGSTSEFSQNFVASTINDAPVVTAPGSALNATEQTILAIHGSGFSVSDLDEAHRGALATLTVGEGAITVVAGNSGVTVTGGNGSGTVTLSGTIAQLNNLLTGAGTGTIRYLNSSDVPSASTTLSVTVNDQGNVGTDPGLTGDGTSEEGSASQTIHIAPVNDAPQAIAHSYSTSYLDDLVLPAPGILTGASDPEGDSLTAVLVSTPASGSVQLASGGGLVYDPVAGFVGQVTFQYYVTDGSQQSPTQVVTINVTVPNNVPSPGGAGSGGSSGGGGGSGGSTGGGGGGGTGGSGGGSGDGTTAGGNGDGETVDGTGGGATTATDPDDKRTSAAAPAPPTTPLLPPETAATVLDIHADELPLLLLQSLDSETSQAIEAPDRDELFSKATSHETRERSFTSLRLSRSERLLLSQIQTTQLAFAEVEKQVEKELATSYFEQANPLVTTAIGTGVVVWLVHAGQLTTALLSTAPVFVQLDPLTVLQGAGNELLGKNAAIEERLFEEAKVARRGN